MNHSTTLRCRRGLRSLLAALCTGLCALVVVQPAAAAVQLFCLAILPSLGLFGLLAGLWLPSLLALMLVYPPIERALGLEAKIRQVQSNH